MARIGYVCISTLDQDLDMQQAGLKAVGCTTVGSEKVSGGSREGRAELATILEFLRPGDELVSKRLDRLVRDTHDAFVTVLDRHVSTRGEMRHIVLTVLGMVAQMERRFIKERQWKGIAATADGISKEGKRRLDRDAILQLHQEGHSA